MLLTFDDFKTKGEVYRRVAVLTIVCATTSGAITASMVQLLLGGDFSHTISGTQFLVYAMCFSIGIPSVLCPIAATRMSLTRLERDAAREELARVAQSDPLTGLLNRRGFDFQTRLLTGSVSRGVQPIAALMCDVDHFKSINDRFGHEFGDVVLCHIADQIRASIEGQSAVASRRGGEEFIVLLFGTPADDVAQLAETVRHACATSPIAWNDMTAFVTISIGVASGVSPTADLKPLIARADQALYAAKRSGRNRVVAAAGLGVATAA